MKLSEATFGLAVQKGNMLGMILGFRILDTTKTPSKANTGILVEWSDESLTVELHTAIGQLNDHPRSK